MRRVKCDNCLTEWDERVIIPLDRVPDLALRLDPGSEVPAGECPDPKCGALVYYVKDPSAGIGSAPSDSAGLDEFPFPPFQKVAIETEYVNMSDAGELNLGTGPALWLNEYEYESHTDDGLVSLYSRVSSDHDAAVYLNGPYQHAPALLEIVKRFLLVTISVNLGHDVDLSELMDTRSKAMELVDLCYLGPKKQEE